MHFMDKNEVSVFSEKTKDNYKILKFGDRL